MTAFKYFIAYPILQAPEGKQIKKQETIKKQVFNN